MRWSRAIVSVIMWAFMHWWGISIRFWLNVCDWSPRHKFFRLCLNLWVSVRHHGGLSDQFSFKSWEVLLLIYEFIMVYVDMDVVKVVDTIGFLLTLNRDGLYKSSWNEWLVVDFLVENLGYFEEGVLLWFSSHSVTIRLLASFGFSFLEYPRIAWYGLSCIWVIYLWFIQLLMSNYKV
jgi:hypothetical protein